MSEQNDIFIFGYESFTEGVLITDNNLSVLSCNKAWKQYFNISVDWTCPHFNEFIQSLSESRVETEPLLSTLTRIRSEPSWTGSMDLRFPDGHVVNLDSRPITNTNHECIGRIWICKGISELVSTIDRSEQSERLFKTIFDLIPEGIAISDLTTGTFYEVNAHFNKWWGYTREEVIGKSAIDLDFWVDINQRIKIMNLLKREGSCYLVPVKMKRKDKAVRDILFSARIISIDNSPYMLSIPFDVTQLMQYEEKLKSLASFIELNPNPIFEINESGTITLCNDSTVKVIQDLTGTDDIYRFIPDDLNEILDAIHNSIETTYYREINIEDRIFIEYIYVTNQYHTARIYLTDITDRKKAERELLKKNDDIAAAYEEIISTEEELRQNYEKLVEQEHVLFENEKKLKIIVDHIPGLVITTDADLNVKSIFGAVLAKMGLSPNTGIGHNIKDIFQSIDASLLDAHIKALQGEVSTIEGYYHDRTFLLYASPIRDAKEKITGTIGIAIDVTEQKTLETERRNLLIQLEKNLVELAYLNDKIRNPLAIIASLVDMHAPEIEEPVNRCVKDIDDIINNLDKRWVESEKTIRFLQKHYGISVEFKK
ncbi:PAS domain S-box protein [Methanospirillum lacunae]|uniref:histidine kinase n=1 Tax=Methanospirillum lacunae TaxID=668570 RepID=A0A2V2MS83_9EURY|nr:PAS domain S-box protein [Methanospirillum lacunae]PWR70259.1 hypothetical protein DK846_15195 [Methanospirillum lacunae]